jgi:hypothetical protein
VENIATKNRAPPSAAKGKREEGGGCAAPEKGKGIKAKRVPINAFS